jgi:hypothetical protein
MDKGEMDGGWTDDMLRIVSRVALGSSCAGGWFWKTYGVMVLATQITIYDQAT